MSEVPTGAMRFNSDSQKLEYWDGAQWLQVSTFSPNLNGGARGLFGGGFTGPSPANAETDVIQYINISSAGNAVDFGDLSATRRFLTSLSSSTRGVFGGGVTPTPATTGFTNTIEYINISSFGDAVDFGDLSAPNRVLSACSNAHGGL